MIGFRNQRVLVEQVFEEGKGRSISSRILALDPFVMQRKKKKFRRQFLMLTMMQAIAYFQSVHESNRSFSIPLYCISCCSSSLISASNASGHFFRLRRVRVAFQLSNYRQPSALNRSSFERKTAPSFSTKMSQVLTSNAPK